jgi:signal recognition particle GTPase
MPPLRTKLSERRESTRARKAMKKAERIINSLTPEEKANLAIGKTAHELIKE